MEEEEEKIPTTTHPIMNEDSNDVPDDGLEPELDYFMFSEEDIEIFIQQSLRTLQPSDPVIESEIQNEETHAKIMTQHASFVQKV